MNMQTSSSFIDTPSVCGVTSCSILTINLIDFLLKIKVSPCVSLRIDSEKTTSLYYPYHALCQ